ncbi:MAG: 50S ribosomal protein L3 [Endomicrobium sp.]|jgi:large subunit ribosomal protein L3|nr:50S ribosomal protein L3 [Endomicrobium sp.]
MLKSIIGKKLGMTQMFEDNGNVVPVTVIKAGPCIVVGIRTLDKDGYSAVQLGFEDVIIEKRLNKSNLFFFKKKDILPKKIVKEFVIKNDFNFNIGQRITLDILKNIDFVDVKGITKGKGYAGVIKRHNFSMQAVTHGQSDRERARGSSGGQGPQRVLKGTKMSGHLGNKYVTIQRLHIVKIDINKDFLFIKGCVPGIIGSNLFISATVKKSI